MGGINFFEGEWAEVSSFGFIKVDGLVKILLKRHPGEGRGPEIFLPEPGNH
jgi:hypothetical protein